MADVDINRDTMETLRQLIPWKLSNKTHPLLIIPIFRLLANAEKNVVFFKANLTVFKHASGLIP